jgi:hypothetical protein
MKTLARQYHDIVNVKEAPDKALKEVQSYEVPDGTSVANISIFSDDSVYVSCNVNDLFYTRRFFKTTINRQCGITCDIEMKIAEHYGGYEKELENYNNPE